MPARVTKYRSNQARWFKFGLCVLPLFVLSLAGCNNFAWNPNYVPNPAPPGQGPPVASQVGNVSISPQYVALGLTQTQQFKATSTTPETLQWSVNGVLGGNATVGTVDSNGKYTAPASVNPGMNALVTVYDASTPLTNYATAVATIIAPGLVTPTINPQVALYSMYLPVPGNMTVSFGPTTDYGLATWTQTTPTPDGGEINMYVAGMRAQTTYHMRAQLTLNDGATFTDRDQTFTTGTPPGSAAVAVTTQNGQIPQTGVEMFDTLIPHENAPVFVTDLQGNVIWTYSFTDGSSQDLVQPITLLPNGHFLALISYLSSIPLHHGTIIPGTIDVVREVDLVGNTIREVTMSQLTSALAAKGYNLNIGSFHHDVLALPNGHWILLASVTQSFTNLPGYPGTTNVMGDMLVDVDQNGQPVWVWNTFDHLDINRHPYLFPDWTHSNAMLYSTDDHNLLLSVRHQNWLLKIDYADGQGSGKILWRLGEGGDFTLLNGVDPTDWFYAQHGPGYFSPNTTGVFRLGIMDNGDDRRTAAGVLCGTTGAPACYSTAPVFQVDETAMTATLLSRYQLPGLYSFWGGAVQDLANGNMDVDFCAASGGSVIQEVNLNATPPQVIWQTLTKDSFQYRTERLPSLYPGVQW